jgi:hypothetical protein
VGPNYWAKRCHPAKGYSITLPAVINEAASYNVSLTDDEVQAWLIVFPLLTTATCSLSWLSSITPT